MSTIVLFFNAAPGYCSDYFNGCRSPHLDIYGDAEQLHESFHLFAKQLKTDGVLFFKEGLPLEEGITYGTGTDPVVQALNIRVEEGTFVFDYKDENVSIKDIPLMLPGKHNIENATVAMAAALKLGIDPEKVKAAIASFKGVKRRFEYIVREDRHVYIDDYAHHPEELRACFDAVRQLYPDKKKLLFFSATPF
ncbi:glutamate ligase domain-containing protein [Pedobacter sp. NJ-S-72]